MEARGLFAMAKKLYGRSADEAAFEHASIIGHGNKNTKRVYHTLGEDDMKGVLQERPKGRGSLVS